VREFALFRERLAAWLAQSSLFPGKNLHIDLILNPEAGAFRHRGQRRALLAALADASNRVPAPVALSRDVRVATWTTDYPGHEKLLLAHLQTADPVGPGDQRLVVIAGGDGTSRGVLISALDLPLETRRNLLFFRLPLGTGNDAAETRQWPLALEALSGRGSQAVEPRTLAVVEVAAAGHPVHFAFNIASVGLDAFVAHLTNRLKAWFPGNSYGLMVDAAAFFYEWLVKVVPSTLELSRKGVPVVTWDQAFLLAAFGASGHRTYGSGKRVLPDDNNFCLAAKKNLFTKLAYRKPFYEGTHRGLPGIQLARGDELRVSSPVRVPLQMDGEVLWLNPNEFPLTLTIVDRGLRILSLVGNHSLA